MNNRQPKFNEEELLIFAKSYLSEAFPNPQRIGCPPVSELACIAELRAGCQSVDHRAPFSLFSVLQRIYGDPGLRGTKGGHQVRRQFLTALSSTRSHCRRLRPRHRGGESFPRRGESLGREEISSDSGGRLTLKIRINYL